MHKMGFLRSILLLLLCSQFFHHKEVTGDDRSFVVDWEGNRFLKDGEAFRFIAGSMHYFRSHPATWQRKLRTLRASGLNAITTYVEWSLHNPRKNMYVWEGIADVEKFIELAKLEDLYVILRPGPYICAERDLGGLPFWLLSEYPQISLRSSDANYEQEVALWYSKLMPRIEPYLYGNGGPIIMVQVENEYGSYGCEAKYMQWVHKETLRYVQDKAVLFTNDGPYFIKCGHIPNVLTTLDFGATNNLTEFWRKLRIVQKKGPLVNIEFYPGWLTHWHEPMAQVSFEAINTTFTKMLDAGASVNFYMFHGGTNFGFTAGANNDGPGGYKADLTSYDYDAPMDEAGNPRSKYFEIQNIVAKYLPMPNISVPSPQLSEYYGSIAMTPCCSILSPKGRQKLSAGLVMHKTPLTFEELNQFSGLVLYETMLAPRVCNPSCHLNVTGIRDRGYVYFDGKFQGVLSREHKEYYVPFKFEHSGRLQILVENQGRINFGPIHDFKGIVGGVRLQREIINDWNMTKYPLESYRDIVDLIRDSNVQLTDICQPYEQEKFLNEGPAIFVGRLFIANENTYDTYLDPTGWGKGIAIINGENIGRYWPAVGPQVTLYIPREVLRIGINYITLIEYERPPECPQITFTDAPIILQYNGTANQKL